MKLRIYFILYAIIPISCITFPSSYENSKSAYSDKIIYNDKKESFELDNDFIGTFVSLGKVKLIKDLYDPNDYYLATTCFPFPSTSRDMTIQRPFVITEFYPNKDQLCFTHFNPDKDKKKESELNNEYKTECFLGIVKCSKDKAILSELQKQIAQEKQDKKSSPTQSNLQLKWNQVWNKTYYGCYCRKEPNEKQFDLCPIDTELDSICKVKSECNKSAKVCEDGYLADLDGFLKSSRLERSRYCKFPADYKRMMETAEKLKALVVLKRELGLVEE